MDFELTKEQVNELKEIFPYGFTSKIAERLNKSGKKSLRGKKYTSKMISDVMTLKRKDINVFIELLSFKVECLKRRQENSSKIKELMKNTAVATVNG